MRVLAPLPEPLQVVLVSPQIPPNTGNVVRTCAVTGARLHLVGPLGFSLDDRHLRRAGLDYWPDAPPAVYRDWRDFAARELEGGGRGGAALHLFTARAERSLYEVDFAPGDYLVFGHEQHGLPPGLLDAWPGRQVAIPMRPGQRSLNLAVAVGVALYMALGRLAAPREVP
jgi:tRNA (cytidine/uridine-2'-O-)-methyltransferase